VDDATTTFVVLGAAVVLFVWNRLPVAVVAMGVALALYAAGVIGVDEAFAGFGDPTVSFIASLFVVSEALDATGVTTWAGQRLVAAAATARAGSWRCCSGSRRSCRRRSRPTAPSRRSCRSRCSSPSGSAARRRCC
jgi:hypothetical protein